jgi:hypothetical protein
MKLTELSALQAGWEQPDSAAPSTSALRTAHEVLASVAQEPWLPKPHIAPLFDGGLLFEWQLGDRDLTVEAMADGRIAVMRGDERGATDQEAPTFGRTGFQQLVHWLQFGDRMR